MGHHQFFKKIGFDTHENYKFRKTSLTPQDIQKIENQEKNQKIYNRAQEKIKEAMAKIKKSDVGDERQIKYAQNFNKVE